MKNSVDSHDHRSVSADAIRLVAAKMFYGLHSSQSVLMERRRERAVRLVAEGKEVDEARQRFNRLPAALRTQIADGDRDWLVHWRSERWRALAADTRQRQADAALDRWSEFGNGGC